MNLTADELCLLAVYDILDKTALIEALRNDMPDMEEPEMIELALSAVNKLESMTDEQFYSLDLMPDYDFVTEEDDETEG